MQSVTTVFTNLTTTAPGPANASDWYPNFYINFSSFTTQRHMLFLDKNGDQVFKLAGFLT